MSLKYEEITMLHALNSEKYTLVQGESADNLNAYYGKNYTYYVILSSDVNSGGITELWGVYGYKASDWVYRVV